MEETLTQLVIQVIFPMKESDLILIYFTLFFFYQYAFL